jgi:poly-beta-1,6-N-acetyl-D-glucosamine N-deacetylase PgaB
VRTALLIIGAVCGGWAYADSIPVLVYHDITMQREADEYSLTREEFERHMAYLQREGYRPVGLEQVERARRGAAALPAKAVMLTFDDGLRSFATHALPVLERHGYPAVLSVVTGWLDGRRVPEAYRDRLLDCDEVRELDRSPLVEVISHSDDLHHGVVANPQGNLAPAVVTREYDPGTGRYEDEEGFRRRIRADLARTSERLSAVLGRTPRAIAWPFGQYDAILVEEARRAGMEYQLTLDEEPTRLRGLPRINRVTFRRFRELRNLEEALTFRKVRREQRRFIEVSLDELTGAGVSSEAQEARLSVLLRRIELLGVNTILLSPFTRDRAGSYFANDQMPVAANLLNRVLHQVRTRNGIEHLYLRVPIDVDVTDPERLFRELARLHRFRGAVIEGETTAGKGEWLATLFRRHQPAIRIGVRGSEVPGWADFGLVRLPVERARDGRQEAPAAEEVNRLYYLIERTVTVTDGDLAAAMRAVREGGARHYGYGPDDFLAGRPDARKLVRELRAYVAPGEGP